MSTLSDPDGEDSFSFEQHNRAFKIEYDKVRPNRAVVDDLVAQSFAMRWNDLHDNSYGLDIVFEKYPFLADVSDYRTCTSYFVHHHGVCTIQCRLFKSWKELLVTVTCMGLQNQRSDAQSN